MISGIGSYRGFVLAILTIGFAIHGDFAQGKLSSDSSERSKCNSFVEISGSTNINQFEFRLEYAANQAFLIKEPIDTTNLNNYYKISIPVRSLETRNKLIYNDFLKLLKADQYPDITIEIPYVHLNRIFSGIACTDHQIIINIAGVAKSYVIPSTSSHCEGDKVYISGIEKIRLSDFHLTPPVKFMGLVKVKDIVSIDFGFMFYVKT